MKQRRFYLNFPGLLSLGLLIIMCACAKETSDLELALRPSQTPTGAAGGLDGSVASHEISDQPVSVYVYVCGAVNHPGVVELPSGSRAEAAIIAAGGFAPNADIDYLNLAALVSDGDKLDIPTLEEAEAQAKQDAAIASGIVNINTADASLLGTLPGIGESRAADIIAYRETHGSFRTIEEIMNVSGIKEAAFNKIRDKICVE
ncbi:MAG: helix-hairpin-helix domain-containing protein [Clostridium sp.]|jgi:competence protein ComEA|nr:helix-hairpin-helix domain-containing protein [Clostridium sp.]